MRRVVEKTPSILLHTLPTKGWLAQSLGRSMAQLSAFWITSWLHFAHAIGTVLACLVPLIPVARISAERAIEASATLCNSFRAQYLYRCCSPTWRQNWSPANLLWRALFGVCGLLALPNIHQTFGDYPAKFPRLAACRGVGLLLLGAVCNGHVFDGNVNHGSLRTSFWGTQWGQLNRSSALLLLLAVNGRRSGALQRFLAWYNSLPHGGLSQGFGSLA
jgi:hypothetical protein